MSQEAIATLQRLCQPKYYSLLNIKELVDEYSRKIIESASIVENMSDPQLKLLSEYQRHCKYHNIKICYDIKTALAKCKDAYCVMYIADLDIYIIIKDKNQYDQFAMFDSSLYDTDGMPVALDVYYRIVLSDSPQCPSLIFRMKEHNKETATRELTKFFGCEVKCHEYVSSGKIQYFVPKEYKTFAECLADVDEFLERNPRIAPSLEERPQHKSEPTDDNLRHIYYVKYPLPRYGEHELWTNKINPAGGNTINVNNTYVIKNNNIVINNKTAKNYATHDQIRSWIEQNPPGDTKRCDYLDMCKDVLGKIKTPDFNKVMSEKYEAKRKSDGYYWFEK